MTAPSTLSAETLAELQTPAAVVDRTKVANNTERMSRRMTGLGVRLRPHVKTHKCLEAARMSVRGHFGGVTVSTLAEAEFFLDGGFRDITYAVPLGAHKIPRVLSLAQRADDFQVLVDHPQTVAALEEGTRGIHKPLSVMMKLDCGSHRAGVSPDGAEGVMLAKQIVAAKNLSFVGVLAHAGHSYACRDVDEIRRVAEEERDVTVAFAQKLEHANVPCPVRSIGSTPTMSVVDDLTGVTEVRPGNYVFYDRFQSAIGSCATRDAAFTVLTTVIGLYKDRAIVDAGALALSKDRGADHLGEQTSYGLVLDEAGERRLGLSVASLSQEHGILMGEPNILATVAVGSRLRIVANHSCLAAALHPRFYIVENGRICEEWLPTRGW